MQGVRASRTGSWATAAVSRSPASSSRTTSTSSTTECGNTRSPPGEAGSVVFLWCLSRFALAPRLLAATGTGSRGGGERERDAESC